jgi:hypothetical protein
MRSWANQGETVSIRVEFYGIPRIRAGVAVTTLETTDVQSLGDVLQRLAVQFPRLVPECIADRRLVAPYTANINGDRFVTNPQTLVPNDAALLIMASDAGG